MGNLSISSLAIDRKVRILVADDHPLLRHALRSILDDETGFTVMGEASTGQEAAKLAVQLAPDVVIMDFGTPGISGIDAIRRIKAASQGTAILILGADTSDEHIILALRAGASGYLDKNVHGDEVVHAIRTIASGGIVLSPGIGTRLIDQASRNLRRPARVSTGERLTIRELDVLDLAAQGLSNKDIAAKLGLSLRTVKGHLSNLFSKMGVESRTEAVIAGLQSGMLSLATKEESATDV